MDLDHAACYRAIATRDVRFDGRLFIGVQTTGIYCRPICPARTPKIDNVIFFRSAAEAQEAKFRPCLRCRPETAPDFGAWRGTANTVSRALSLIEAGALDSASIGDLANRLGVGERQLRRLFDKHLGASPITVAQTRRVLLAKQLIHDTQLSMTDVALAAGFGSVRQFNEVFQRLYGRPPSSLRRAKPPVSAVPAATEITLRLSYRPPYDWDGILHYLKTFAIPEVELVDGLAYCRSIDVDGAVGYIDVRPSSEHSLEAVVQTPRLAALPAILMRLRRVFDLSADPEPISRHLAQDPLLAPLVAARPGLRVPGAWDGFEFAVRILLGEGNGAYPAGTSIRNLVNTYGNSLPVTVSGRNGLKRIFPRPAVLATADLTLPGISSARASAIAALAQMVSRGRDPFRAGQSLDDAIAQLKEVPEIDDATAQYIAMRQFREPDAFPPAVEEFAQLCGREHAPIRHLSTCIESWRPWRAYAAQYFWHAQNVSDVEQRAVDPGLPRRPPCLPVNDPLQA
ncbi:AlkA N-terminal domain-containing protein [Bradyrhizobium sp. ORS 375]|uniref:bifunctional transcriptional activator/DNA repair enzyme AdaA n=1 Tax=Bradyrhizobium sp. (strain ORS 375) TaxID=566679 RepID=UPI0009FD3E25